MTLREFILTYINSSAEIHIIRNDNASYLVPAENKRTEVKLYEEGRVFNLSPIEKDLENYLLGLTKFKVRPEGTALFISVIEN